MCTLQTHWYIQFTTSCTNRRRWASNALICSIKRQHIPRLAYFTYTYIIRCALETILPTEWNATTNLFTQCIPLSASSTDGYALRDTRFTIRNRTSETMGHWQSIKWIFTSDTFKNTRRASRARIWTRNAFMPFWFWIVIKVKARKA